MVWFRETGKGEAFSWLERSSSAEWWTFDRLVCQKLHHQTNRRDLSAAGDSLYQQWLRTESGSGWFPLWQSGFLHAVDVEGTRRSFWWSFCWEHFLWATAGTWRGTSASTVWILPCMNANPSMHLQISLCWHLCFCFFSVFFFWEFTKRLGKPVTKVPGKSNFLPVTECSQPVQTAESFPQG